MKRLMILPVLCAALFMTQGCREKGPAERAGESIDKAGRDLERTTVREKDDISDEAKKATRKAGDAVEDAGDKVKDAARDVTR